MDPPGCNRRLLSGLPSPRGILKRCFLLAVCFLGASTSAGAKESGLFTLGCCKICKQGTACGNSCISRGKTCRAPTGCACDATRCCKFCSDGQACGDACIKHTAVCKQPPGCACSGPSGKDAGSRDWAQMLRATVKNGDLVKAMIHTLADHFEL
ncbi:unnamed protein product [Polarella glacialis]|uniref:Uncharacterized protein n=1 Tax=Polarella glacialis TaxID=89957 RepID=A0A813KB28_POLGL|nr:unnamed protein product [Polarella glacialis]